MSSPARRARVFFAIWPSRAEAASLHRLAGSLEVPAARLMRAETLHLTLAFVGDVNVAELSRLGDAARGLDGREMRLNFDELGWWRHNRILWIGCRQPPRELSALASDLRTRLGEAGFRLEPRPFRPHVTLMRRASAVGELPAPQLVWQVSRVVLVRSRLSPGGASYEVLEDYPLRSGCAGGSA